MIRLELFVDDKKVAKLLHAIDGLVVQMTIGPVHNAVPKKGKLAEAGQPTTGNELINFVISECTKQGKNEFSTKHLVEVGEKFGIPRSAAYAALGYASNKYKTIKLVKRGLYSITI